MTDEERNAALYEKMAAEQSAYKDWLLKQTPEEILNHTYEYTVREDILITVENGELTGEQAGALLKSDTPLADVYGVFQKTETGYMDTLRECVEERANAEIQRDAERRRALKETPLYLFPAAYAREHGELEQYRASRNANIACRDAIDAAIREHYDGSRLDGAAVREVTEAFGYERTLHVLANTVRQKEWDGRFSEGNKRWAHTLPIHENPDGMGNDRNRDFVLRSHSALADAFIKDARHEYLLTQPLTTKETIDEAKRIYAGLTAAKEPNSPDGTRFMVEISPDFLKRASGKDFNGLTRLLPFKSLSFSPLDGRKGTYAMISKDEDRSSKKELKKPSVRRKLEQQPDAPAAPKPPAKRKARKPER